METNVDHERLARAQARFEPVARVLDRVAEGIEKEHGSSAVLKQRRPMEPAAQNAYEVRYSLRHPDGVRFALTFIVAGEDADLLLLEAQERSGPENIKVNPAQVDQRVYRLEKIEEIEKAVQEKISAHLRARQARGTPQAA